MIHVSYLLGFGKHHTLVIWPQMGHASLAVLAKSRSLVPEDASPANRCLGIEAWLESQYLHVYFPYFYRESGRGVLQSVDYFHDLFFKMVLLVILLGL